MTHNQVVAGSSPAGPSRRQLFSGYLFFILALTCSPDVNAQRQKSYFVSSGLMINQIVVPEFAEYSDYIKISPSLGTSLGIGKNVTKKGKFYTSLSVGIESPRIPDGMTAYDLTDRVQEIDNRLTPTRFYFLTTLNNIVSTNYSVPCRATNIMSSFRKGVQQSVERSKVVDASVLVFDFDAFQKIRNMPETIELINELESARNGHGERNAFLRLEKNLSSEANRAYHDLSDKIKDVTP